MSDSKNHSWSSRLFYWTLAVVLLLLGFYLSEIRFMQTEWLSRAGCLIVILGIWSSVGSILQERVLGSRIRWRRRNALTESNARHLAEKRIPTRHKRKLTKSTSRLRGCWRTRHTTCA